MLKFIVLLGLFGASMADDVYTSDLKDTVDAELAMVKAIYGDQFDELYIGDFATEDFSLKNIRMKGLSRIQTMGPCTLYVNTIYLTAFAQALIGVENAEFLVEEFKAPYLFYEGNETLTNVRFSVKSVGLNIHEGFHVDRPSTCNVGYGLELMQLDNSTLYSSNPKFNGKDVTPFVHYTVRLAINDFLAKKAVQIPPIKSCIPFAHSPSMIQTFLSSIFH